MEINCSPIEFEAALKLLFERMGFSVEMTKASGDGGVDLNVTNPARFVGGRYIVQAKRYQGSVGEPVVRDFYGTLHHSRALKAILITSGFFSKPAMAFAEGKPIELIDGDELRLLIERYGLHSAFSVETSSPNVPNTPPSTSPFLPLANTGDLPVQDKKSGLSSAVAVILFCLAVGCLYSTYHHSGKSSESTPISAPIQSRETPQQASTPAPEKVATEPLATPAIARQPTLQPLTTPPVPTITEAPDTLPTKALIGPTASDDARKRALRKYPELGVAGSPFNRVFVLRYQRYQSKKPDFFTDPEWPTKLADECAKDFGMRSR